MSEVQPLIERNLAASKNQSTNPQIPFCWIQVHELFHNCVIFFRTPVIHLRFKIRTASVHTIQISPNHQVRLEPRNSGGLLHTIEVVTVQVSHNGAQFDFSSMQWVKWWRHHSCCFSMQFIVPEIAAKHHAAETPVENAPENKKRFL